jgi:hypothetical protein
MPRAIELEQQIKRGKEQDQRNAEELFRSGQSQFPIGDAPLVQPAAAIPAFDPEISQRMLRQQAIERTGQYEIIGKLERIQIGADGIPLDVVMSTPEGMRKMPNPILNQKLRTASLDWLNTGPGIGLSADQKEMIVLPPVLAPPPIPDPAWQAPPLHDANGVAWQDHRDGNGELTPEAKLHLAAAYEPQRVDQTLPFFAWGGCTIGAETWMVFHPIHQMLFLGVAGDGPVSKAWAQGGSGAGDNTGFLTANWRADNQGRHCMLLYNPDTKKAHILGGLFQLKRY